MHRRHPRSGNALASAFILTIALSAIVAALFTLMSSEYMKSRRWRDETRSFYVAEAGLSEVFATLAEQGEDGLAALTYPKQFGQGFYEVEITLGENEVGLLDNRLRLRSFGEEGRERAGIDVIAWAVPNGKYLFALFGADGVKLNSNVLIDSFNSENGPYGSILAEGTLANVGSNQDIILSSNDSVSGDVIPGPTGSVILPPSDTYVFGSTAPAEDLVVLDPIVVPSIALSGNLNVAGAMTIGPGNLHKGALTIQGGGNLTIKGPTTLVVDDFTMLSNSNLLIDATNGPVEIYGTKDFELRSNTYITTVAEKAKDVSVFLSGNTDSPDNATIVFNSNADFIGTVYAPNADITLASNFEVFGSIMAESLELASNTNLHFDEDLLYEDGVIPDYEQLAWRVLSRQEE